MRRSVQEQTSELLQDKAQGFRSNRYGTEPEGQNFKSQGSNGESYQDTGISVLGETENEIEEKVERAMKNLKFETKDENGKWKEVREEEIRP